MGSGEVLVGSGGYWQDLAWFWWVLVGFWFGFWWVPVGFWWVLVVSGGFSGLWLALVGDSGFWWGSDGFWWVLMGSGRDLVEPRGFWWRSGGLLVVSGCFLQFLLGSGGFWSGGFWWVLVGFWCCSDAVLVGSGWFWCGADGVLAGSVGFWMVSCGFQWVLVAFGEFLRWLRTQCLQNAAALRTRVLRFSVRERSCVCERSCAVSANATILCL